LYAVFRPISLNSTAPIYHSKSAASKRIFISDQKANQTVNIHGLPTHKANGCQPGPLNNVQVDQTTKASRKSTQNTNSKSSPPLKLNRPSATTSQSSAPSRSTSENSKPITSSYSPTHKSPVSSSRTKANTNSNKWNCPSCTLLNDRTLLCCSLCSTPRPSPSLHPSALHQSPPSVPGVPFMPSIGAPPEPAIASPSYLTVTPQTSKRAKKKAWKKVHSASSYLQFEYSDTGNRRDQQYLDMSAGGNGQPRSSSINDMANYGLDDYEFNDMESIISSNISHSSTKNLRQLTRNSIYKNTFDAAADSRFKTKREHKSPGNGSSSLTDSNGHSRKGRKRYSKYTITDIFASNSSFILDHEYNEEDICNLILNSSSQTQTKIKFLKSIWPHILRVTTRVSKKSKFRCPICLDQDIFGGRITECGHCFCGTCLLHHLFSYQQSTKNEREQRLIPEIKEDEDFNFTDLFGHCPLCHEYVSFEQARPLTVIRCNDYKVNDCIDLVLIERCKGEQPQFFASPAASVDLSHDHSLNISTFRKFVTEKHEISHCDKELHEIEQAIKSADPIYEEPYLRLLAAHVQQYKAYILHQRRQYKVSNQPEAEKKNDHNDEPATNRPEISEESAPYKHEPVVAKPASSTFDQYRYYQHPPPVRYRKKKYVYQASDGQLIFLHPHNYNMIKHDRDFRFDRFPLVLRNCKILEIQRFEQSYDLRRIYPFLGFIPNDIQFSFIEVDLSGIVSKRTLKYFEKSTKDREQSRAEQERKMQEELKHRQVMEEQRVALQKQKYARPQIDIHDYSEFPSLTGGAADESQSDNNSDPQTQTAAPNANASNLSRRSPAQRSWSEMMVKPPSKETLDSPPLVAVNRNSNLYLQSLNNQKSNNTNNANINEQNGSANGSQKKKRRRGGRNKKKQSQQ